MHIPVLTTERLQLAGPAEDQLDGLLAIYGDAATTRHIRGGQTFDRAGTWFKIASHLGHWHLRGFGFWTVLAKDDGRVVGHVGLLQPAGVPAVEIGWAICRSEWGKGFAFEVAQAVLAFAWNELQLPRVVAVIEPANIASLALAQKLGMRLNEAESTAELLSYDGFPA